jgi:hypothetical protein
MTAEQEALPDARLRTAAAALQATLAAHYPDATFAVFHADDPDGLYVQATVDLDEPEVILDVVRDQLYELEVEQGLPIYVVAEQPAARVAQGLQAQRGQPQPRLSQLPL